MIALMGATVAALQAWNHTIAKVIVGSIGILITTLTFVEKQVFEYDYRTYHDRVVKAENLEYDINRDINMLKVQLSDKFPMNTSENDFINKELARIRGKVVQINELGKGLKHLPFFLIPSAHAIHASRPDDLILAGIGINTSLSDAERKAADDLIRNVRDTVLKIADHIYEDLSSFRKCVLSHKREQLYNDVVNRFQGLRDDSNVERVMEPNGYKVTFTSNLKKSLIVSGIRSTIDAYVAALAETTVCNQTQADLAGYYVGEWSSNMYRAQGEARAHLEVLNGNQVKVYLTLSGGKLQKGGARRIC
jgi:hypothetical protein